MTKQFFIFLLAIHTLVRLELAPAHAQQTSTLGPLQRLVDAARREGQLDLMAPTDLNEAEAKTVVGAFNRRFGLDLRINADVSGLESQKFNAAIAETKSGIAPTFDALQGSEANISSLEKAGGAEPIEHWDKILAEISSEAYEVREKISPSIISGYSFVYATRVGVLLYNPKLISERELPKTWKEMGDPKFAGAFSLPPWTSHFLEGLLRYDKEALLEIAKALGRSKPVVLNYKAAIQRMMLGEFKFVPARSHDYYRQKAIDPGAPLSLSFLEDVTSLSSIGYVVRKGARHPNAAKLFALWMAGSSEAQLVLEKYSYNQNLVFSSSPVSREMLKTLRTRNIEPVGWFDNSETVQKFQWLTTTAEGQNYSREVAQALRRGS